MMNSWNSVIFMKSDKSMADMNEMAKWEGVDKMWSTSGDWDWCVQLKSSSPEDAEKMVMKMRKGQWATQTKTNWWKQISA